MNFILSGLFIGFPTADNFIGYYDFEFVLVILVCLLKHCFSKALLHCDFLFELSYHVETFPFYCEGLDSYSYYYFLKTYCRTYRILA